MSLGASVWECISGSLKFLAANGILAVIIAVTGWVFVYKNSRALQKRNEVWAIVKNISDLLKEIEVSSRKFWVPHDGKFISGMSYQSEINTYIRELERWLSLLSMRVSNDSLDLSYKSNVAEVFQYSTFDIEGVADMAETKRLRIITNISMRVRVIKDKVDLAYKKEFF